MIIVKGFKYYNDNNMPSFTKQFENVGQLGKFIQDNTLGKSRIHFPAHNEDGTFDQEYAGTFSGTLYYDDERRYNDGDISTHIELITDNDTGKILFSSGSLTDKKGHISTSMKEMLDNLRSWTKEEYDFAD